jgi:Fe-S cluster assembly ATP-binding protein
MLDINNLHAETSGKQILSGLQLKVMPGEVHAIMGPNGSGKSTLGKILAGHPEYQITDGEILYQGTDIRDTQPHELARKGIFLAFQYPTEIPGVSNMEFLKASIDAHYKAQGKEQLTTSEFIKSVRGLAADVGLNPEFLKRGVNEGFSGGEKKRNEILQLKLLNPSLAILDETDSGLDIDALKVVANGINGFKNTNNAIVLITHYQRLLDYVVPDHVHVLSEGKIIQSGDKSLAFELEEKGYSWLN